MQAELGVLLARGVPENVPCVIPKRVPSCRGAARGGTAGLGSRGVARGGTAWLGTKRVTRGGSAWLGTKGVARGGTAWHGLSGSWSKPLQGSVVAEQQQEAGIRLVVTRAVGSFLSSFFLGAKVPAPTIPALMSSLRRHLPA